MNAPFDQLSLVQRLEREGIARGAAEAIAGGIEDARSELVTSAMLRAELEVVRAEARADAGILRAEFDILRAEFAALRAEFAALRGEFVGLRGEFASFKEEVRLTLELNYGKFEHRQNQLVVRLTVVMFALVTLATAVLGTIIALK